MLTILSIGHPLSVISDDSVGGTEQILSALDRAIVDAGYRSLVIAPAGSTCCGELLPVVATAGPIDTPAFYACHDSCRRQIAAALARERIDIVHMHGVDFMNYAPNIRDIPILATLHMWPSAYPSSVFTNRRRNFHLQCVSNAQRRACPHDLTVDVIPNGVDVDSFSPAPVREPFALVLGRICPEKGVHLAIDAAQEAGIPLVIAGFVFPYPSHQHYFDTAIAPRLGDGVHFVGPLRGHAKRRILATARCVIVPSLVQESSSLSAIEALASGTPVIAFRQPALEEILEHGRTGWLVEKAADLPIAVGRVSELSRDACREAATARFSLAAMRERYLATYCRLARPPRASTLPARPSSAAVATSIRSTLLTSLADLERLADEWRILAASCPWSTPFQTPEWLLPWIQHLATGPITGAAFHKGGRLVGLVPLVATGSNEHGVLQMAGAGVSDYLSPLAVTDAADDVLKRFVSMVAGGAFGLDAIDIEQVPTNHPLLHIPVGTPASIIAGEVCPVLDLVSRTDSIPPHMRANVRYYWRRAERRGTARIESATSTSLRELTNALFALHRARWASRRLSGTLASVDLQAFHCEAIRAMHDRAMLAMHALRLDDRVIAISYGMQWNRRAYSYLAGFDPDYEDLSPGTLIIDAAIQKSLERGASTFDFLRGAESYKYLWGARDSQTARWRLKRQGRA